MTDTFNKYVQLHWERRKELLPIILERTNNKVIRGPFEGMEILPKYTWGDGDIIGKLLAIYEDELFPIIEYENATRYPSCIINVGCAEGYYGIGMAMKQPESNVVCIDISNEALGIARENASVNNVDNIIFMNTSTIEVFNYYIKNNPSTFIIMDVEGKELDLLDPTLLCMDNVSILVETHSIEIKDTLIDRFKDTHAINIIPQGPKNPHIDILADMNDYDKWIACCEGRFGGTMHWLYIRPLDV